MTNKTAIEKGYLEDKVIILKPSPRVGKMGITDPKHIAYFQHDQATTFFSLPRNNRGDLVNIFKDDEEKKFFEEVLGLDLNLTKKGNFFESFRVKVTMDSKVLFRGESFRMIDPMDNLRIRILKENKVVAESWEKRKDRMEYRWALIDESKINEEAEVKYDSQKEFWKLMGRHEETPKLRSLLRVYFNTISSTKIISADMSMSVLQKEVNIIFDDEKARKNLLKVAGDNLFKMKEMVIQALEVKAVNKEGAGTYLFAGEEKTFTFNEMAQHLFDLKKTDGDLYFKVKEQIDKKNK